MYPPLKTFYLYYFNVHVFTQLEHDEFITCCQFLKCKDYTNALQIQSTSYRPSSEELPEEPTSLAGQQESASLAGELLLLSSERPEESTSLAEQLLLSSERPEASTSSAGRLLLSSEERD